MHKRQVAMAKAALAAARLSLEKGLTTSNVAEEAKVHRSSVTYARIIVLYGTPEEIQAVETGKIGVQTMGVKIRERLTPEQRSEQQYRKMGRDETVADAYKFNKDLWALLKVGIVNLSKMPDVNSVVAIVKSNSSRENTTNQHIQAARAWLEEFAHAWEQHQQSKNNHANSGGSSEPSGTQYPKSAA